MTGTADDKAAPTRGGAQVESLEVLACTVPTDAAEGDGTLTWQQTTIVVVQVVSNGVTGTGWTYGPPACADVVQRLLGDSVLGSDAMAVPGTWEAMVRSARNATTAGLVQYAVSALDVALWDLKARLLGVALADLFGRVQDRVRVYGSGGFTTYPDEVMVEQLRGWAVEQDIPRVKIKIGESWGTRTDRDLHRMRTARETIGAERAFFVDANGGYSVKQAARLMQQADAEGLDVTWLEEPVTSEDLPGLGQVREQVRCDVTAGEYGTGVDYFQAMCAARAVDCLQIDATRCGGYTAWLRAASVAAAHHIDVSAHCAPNLHAHVGAATPHLRHLEWFHDHVRIEGMLFDGALDPQHGRVRPDPARPGHGLSLDTDTAERYRVRHH